MGKGTFMIDDDKHPVHPEDRVQGQEYVSEKGIRVTKVGNQEYLNLEDMQRYLCTEIEKMPRETRPNVLADWKEHLVGLVAHELWHRWQPGHGKKAEIMCELVESDAIDTYRREQGYTFTPPAEAKTENENIPDPVGAGTDQRLHLQLSLQPQ